MARTPENLPLKTPLKNAAQKPPPAFTIRQTRLCAELGMSEDELRRRREYFLNQGQHWDYVDKRVQYSEVGAQVLRGTREAVVPARVDARPTATDSARARRPAGLLLEKNPVPGAMEFKGELIVWAAPPRNSRVVICYLPGGDPLNPMHLVSLRVRDNSNFLRGMKVPDDKPPGDRVKVTAVKDRHDAFELQGPTPRWRGRW